MTLPMTPPITVKSASDEQVKELTAKVAKLEANVEKEMLLKTEVCVVQSMTDLQSGCVCLYVCMYVCLQVLLCCLLPEGDSKA